ncbi:MAG: hypothetical protein V4731_15205 [Pseudomonadota bacterium]
MTAFIHDGNAFRQSFEATALAVTDLFSLCGPSLDAGPLGEGDDRFGFSVTGRQQRPAEFLQAWLDLMRVTFEPSPPGTMFLNSNWDFVSANVPAGPFALGYLSVLGEEGEDVAVVAQRCIGSRMRELGYGFERAQATFVSVVFGEQLRGRKLRVCRQAQEVFGGGFRLEAAMAAIESVALGQGYEASAGDVFVGTAYDASIPADRLRISVWMYSEISAVK